MEASLRPLAVVTGVSSGIGPELAAMFSPPRPRSTCDGGRCGIDDRRGHGRRGPADRGSG
jgi:hypothetical protein